MTFFAVVSSIEIQKLLSVLIISTAAKHSPLENLAGDWITNSQIASVVSHYPVCVGGK